MSERSFKLTLIMLGLAAAVIIGVMIASTGRSHDHPGSSMVVCGLLIGSYFFPSICASMRGHHQIVPIFLTNLFFGWTGLGWIGTLIWSASAITYKRL